MNKEQIVKILADITDKNTKYFDWDSLQKIEKSRAGDYQFHFKMKNGKNYQAIINDFEIEISIQPSEYLNETLVSKNFLFKDYSQLKAKSEILKIIDYFYELIFV